MATSNSFATLTRNSKRGVTPTLGSGQAGDQESMAAPLAIGAVDDPGAPLPTLAPPPIAGNVFAQLHRGSIDDEAPFAREYKESASPFSALERGESKSPQRAARRDVHAIKVVTRLVQAMAFQPGSSAPSNVKSATLKKHLVDVHHMACELAGAAAPQEANRPWVMAQCAEAVAELVARHSEVSRSGITPREQVAAVCDVLRSAGQDDAVAQALDGLQESQYVAATDPEIARDRISVSLAAAIWGLHECVAAGKFDYGLDAVQLVKALSSGIVKTASEAMIQIASLDMQTAHLQGTVRRLAALIGAEYSSRTRAVAEWIDADDAGRVDRARSAQESFPKVILPEILSNARKNFIAIEKIAPALIDEARQSLELNTRTDGGSPQQPGDSTTASDRTDR